jgi:hypothetical protein
MNKLVYPRFLAAVYPANQKFLNENARLASDAVLTENDEQVGWKANPRGTHLWIGPDVEPLPRVITEDKVKYTLTYIMDSCDLMHDYQWSRNVKNFTKQRATYADHYRAGVAFIRRGEGAPFFFDNQIWKFLYVMRDKNKYWHKIGPDVSSSERDYQCRHVRFVYLPFGKLDAYDQQQHIQFASKYPFAVYDETYEYPNHGEAPVGESYSYYGPKFTRLGKVYTKNLQIPAHDAGRIEPRLLGATSIKLVGRMWMTPDEIFIGEVSFTKKGRKKEHIYLSLKDIQRMELNQESTEK